MARKMMKVSFLMAAHNEEKIIGQTLENLMQIPYKNYEVIIGLDGCTDKTEEIVKKFVKRSNKIKYYKLNMRRGKHHVINNIIKKTKGEIIIINDADWIFKVKDKKTFEKFISVFDDKKIGGVAESFPTEWGEKLKGGNIGYKMESYSSYLWYSYQKKRFTYKKGDLLYAKEPTMFLTNVFRKELYKPIFSLGDDFERSQHIMQQGYEIVLHTNPHMPRIQTAYNRILLKELFKQKIRTAIARKQLSKGNKLGINLVNYYIPANWYILKMAWKTRVSWGVIISLWLTITVIATLLSALYGLNTEKGWTIRFKR